MVNVTFPSNPIQGPDPPTLAVDGECNRAVHWESGSLRHGSCHGFPASSCIIVGKTVMRSCVLERLRGAQIQHCALHPLYLVFTFLQLSVDGNLALSTVTKYAAAILSCHKGYGEGSVFVHLLVKCLSGCLYVHLSCARDVINTWEQVIKTWE